jgi:hypothetical protein
MKFSQNMKKVNILLITLLFFVSSFSAIAEGRDTSWKNNLNHLDQNPGHIPTWMINDTWMYEADIYSDTENGLFDVTSDDLTLLVHNITTITHQNETVSIYNITITGNLNGTFDTPDFSGDISGTINGFALIRQADLSLIHTNISSNGIIQWTIFNFDYKIDSIASYYPGFEYFDFPINVNESWNTSSTVHQNSSMYVESFYDNETESTSSMEGNASCDAILDVSVPAGTFSSYHIISEGNGTIESYYNESVKSMVKLFVNQSNETSTTTINLNLSSYNLTAQDLQVSATLNPLIVTVDDPFEISGTIFDSTNQPLQNTQVTIQIPYTQQSYTTITDTQGTYSLTLSAPLLLDPTNTSYDIGSDGIIVTATNNSQTGYKIVTLTVIGIAVDEVKTNPSVQYERNNVNLSCRIYSVEPIVEKTVNITGPVGFAPLDVSLIEANNDGYYYIQSYSIIGNYTFFIWTKDASGNTNKSQLCQFSIIEDNVPSIIQNVTAFPNPQYANNSVNISCFLTDNVAVDQARIIITNPLGSQENISLIKNQNMYWYETIYTTVGNYSYFIWTKDTLGNTNQTELQTFSILPDNLPPTIEDNTSTVGYYNQSFTFSANITDNAYPSTIWVEYWYDSEAHINETMTFNEENNWQKTITISSSKETLYYIISANDTSNNWNNIDIKNVTLYEYETIDVNQSVFDRGFRLMPGWDAAQEFIPNYSTLSRVDLYLAKAGSYDGDVTFQILKDNVMGDVVFEDTLSACDVPGPYSWISIDMDIPVNISQKYVIVLKDAMGASAYDNILWGWCDSFASGSGGPYDNGWFWFRKDGNVNWLSQRDWDFSFRTHGFNL